MKATAPQEPQLSATPWTATDRPAPGLIAFPSRENFPQGLIWSGSGEVPAVGQRVRIHVNSLGEATVKGYFHQDGFLGVLVAPDAMPAHLRGVSTCHVFGIELEPRRSQPCFKKPNPAATVSTDWIPDYPESAAVAA